MTTKSKLAKNQVERPCGCGRGFERPDLAALAALYWSPPKSDLLREDLLERARLALGKYGLEQEELEDTAPLLASAMHMLIEQNGGKPLPAEYAREIEHQVLKWCGCDAADRPREEAELRREYRKNEAAQPSTPPSKRPFPRGARTRPHEARGIH